LSFGKYSYGTITTHWDNDNAKLIVGKFCSIASNVHAYLGGNHRTDWVTTYPFGHVNKEHFNNFDGTATKGDIIIQLCQVLLLVMEQL
jgi:acetyltransferase-like isoleucine patch superfamily enzyme